MQKLWLRRLIKIAVQPMFQPWVPFKLRRVLMHSTALLQRKQKEVDRSRVKLHGSASFAPIAASSNGLSAAACAGKVAAYCAQPSALTVTDSTQHILYLHGGGYVFGGEYTHRQLVDGLALLGNAVVWMPDYRLAPEHPFPAAIHDALAAYTALLAQGIAGARITIAGDSAGGGLAMALALVIRDMQLPAPQRMLLFSPWVDLTVTRTSHSANAKLDPMLIPQGLASCAAAYCGTTPSNHALCSPLFANLAGLPPVYIQVGSDEILLDDARELHHAIQQAGGESELQEFADLWHVFQLHSHQLPEATAALRACFTT